MSRRGAMQAGRRGDPGAGFVPTQLGSALLAWFSSDVGVSVGSGTVSQWNDRSGNGHNATQGVPANQPAYTASGGPNGAPYLSTSGATVAAGLATGAFAIAQATDIFAVAKWTTSAAFKYLCDGVGGGNTLAILSNNSATLLAIEAGTLLSSGVTTVPAAFCTYNATLNGGSSQLTVQGVQIIAPGAAGAGPASGITLFNNQSLTAAVNAQMTEFLVAVGITAAQRSQVIAYLQGKYGVT